MDHSWETAVITEASRHAMYRHLEEVLGHETATQLMEHLPPVGWADVATKRDLDHLETRIELRLEQCLRAQTRWLTGVVFAALSVSTAVSLVAGALSG